MSSLIRALADKFTKKEPKAKFLCPSCKRPLFYHGLRNIFYCEFCRVPYGATYIMRLYTPS